MFSLLGPQTAIHSSGFVVRILSRETVELVEADGSVVSAAIEFGAVSTIYLDTLSKRGLDGTLIPLSALSAGQAAQKLEAGLTAMGGKYEVV